MKKIVLVTVDFDLPVISVQGVGENEFDELFETIELDGGKENNSFDQFLEEVGVNVDFVDEMSKMTKFVRDVLSSCEVCETCTFASGEVGYGFYVMINDENNDFDVDFFVDYV